MRIAVMADIHSNHIALEACIAEAKQRHAEEFLFLGDYLGELAYPEKTLELLGWIRSQYPCAFIRGNKEEYWINHKNGKHGDWVWESGKSGSGMLAYVYGCLTQEQIEEFERMPISMVMRYYGLPSFTICHGSPWKANESMREDYDYIDAFTKRLENRSNDMRSFSYTKPIHAKRKNRCQSRCGRCSTQERWSYTVYDANRKRWKMGERVHHSSL